MFYSTFTFYFPQTSNTNLVDERVGNTLNDRARNLIRNIASMILVRSYPHLYTEAKENEVSQAFEAIVRLLPNVLHVEVSVAVVGHDVSEWQLPGVVNRTLKVLSPFKNVSSITVRGGFHENEQRSQTLNRVRKALANK